MSPGPIAFVAVTGPQFSGICRDLVLCANRHQVSGYEPKSKSAERLTIRGITVEYPPESACPEVLLRLRYEPWCCSEPHELADAVQAAYDAITDSIRFAERERQDLIDSEYDQIRRQIGQEARDALLDE